jgi:transcriptional regulator with XRE-family HTH domain
LSSGACDAYGVLRRWGDAKRLADGRRRQSLADVANVTGMSKGHLSSIEQGLAAITVENVERVALGLRLSPMYIFAFAKDDERARIADLILDLPARELVKLRREIQERRKAVAAAETHKEK